MTLLQIDRLTKHYGGVTAVNRVSFEVHAGEILAVIGPNGAGKTTLFNLITGVAGPDQGQISFKGKVISGLPVDQIASLGITRTFQNLQIFHNMTVMENVMVGAHRHGRKNLLQTGLNWGVNREETEISRRALEKVRLVGLEDKKDILAEILPYGEQRLVEIARAMAVGPDLILLDEPAAGLNTAESIRLAQLIRTLPQMGMTVLLVEHNMEMVMSIADRIVVLEYGALLANGTPAEIQGNPQVIAAYLGQEVV